MGFVLKTFVSHPTPQTLAFGNMVKFPDSPKSPLLVIKCKNAQNYLIILVHKLRDGGGGILYGYPVYHSSL